MKYEAYLRALDKISVRRKNEIIRSVNYRIPKNRINFNDEVEDMFFNRLMDEACKHEKEYGFWPTFALYEIEYDDPILDIYATPVEEWVKERRNSIDSCKDGMSI